MSLEIQIGADISGVEQGIKKAGESIKGLKAPVLNAQNTLTSFSGVVRDLPFGFIGIQNNLPMVVDSFSQLSQQAGALPALKALGASLIGPAGLSFAFGALVAGTTGLIQKYGSLGNAIDVIFSKSSELAKAQQDYNKELIKSVGGTQTEIAEINILTKTLANLDAPMKDRQAAYVELKKISPDIVAGIANENNLTQKQIGIILANADARKKNLLLKAQEAAISNVLNKNAEDMMKLEIEREPLLAKVLELRGKLNDAEKRGVTAGQAINTTSQLVTAQLGEAEKALSANINAYNSLVQVNDKYVGKLTPVISAIAQEDLNTKKLNDSLKEQKVIRENIIDSINRTTKVQPLQLSFKNTNVDPFQNIIDGTKHVQEVLNAWIEQNQINKIQKQFELASSVLQNVFFNPLTDIFSTFFETGKIAFKDFAKSVISSISQIVSKIIATGIIRLIANLLSGGAGGAFGTLSAGGFFKSVVGSVLGIGQVAAPSFAGIGGGAMGMTGSVNLTLRGADLVGAINRTNSQIKRVG